MRRLFVAIVVLCGLIVVPTEASAQFDLSRALGSLLGGGAQQTATTTPYTELAEKAPAKSRILGTWQYKTASMEYLGNNPLADVAIKQLESLALAELKRRGIVEGCCSLTLRRNGMAVIATLDAVQDMTYKYNEDSARMDISTTVGNSSYSAKGYVKMSSDRLVVLVDARDILNGVVKASPELASNQSVVMARSLLENFSDIYIGVIFER